MEARPPVSARLIEGRGLVTLILVGAVVWSLFSAHWGRDALHPGGARSAVELLKALFTPVLTPAFLKLAVESSWTTVRYSVAGITLAIAIGLPLGIAASGVLASSRRSRWASIAIVRLLLAVLRSIHELVWAWFLVVAIGLSPMAAILALAIPYGGILGRVYSELLADAPEQPLRALRSTGASELKVLFYGRLPMALPDMLGYTFYRLECGIRSVAIMSFVGIAGLGFQIRLSLDDLYYDEVWTLLFFLIALVALVDIWSNVVRRSVTR